MWRRLFPGHGSHVRAARKLPALLLKYTRSGEHGGWFGVETGLTPRWAWVAVRDLGGVFIPVASAPEIAGGLAEGGRALFDPQALASRLEVCGSAATGRCWGQSKPP